MPCNAVASTTDELVHLLGGTNRVAGLLNVGPPAVSNWLKTGIPPAHHVRLLAMCAQRGIFWRPPGWPRQLQLRWREAIEPADPELAQAA